MTGHALAWFRRDLRITDHAVLAAASATHERVHCAFVFDADILGRLEARDDPRVTFIRESVRELGEALAARGGGLHVLHGAARDEIPRLARALGVRAVFAARDYEPESIARDAAVASRLRADGIAFEDAKDHVILEAHEVTTGEGRPYSIFTPYLRAWTKRLAAGALASREVPARDGWLAPGGTAVPEVEALGFTRRAPAVAPGMSGAARAWNRFRRRIDRYEDERDLPALAATSGLGAHLRFGTISVRALAAYALRRGGPGATRWLSELAWRDFFFAVLATTPEVVDHAFRPAFDALAWEDDEAGWRAWCEGRTGYPLVDAAMRELAARGTMHNRLRMVAASFLVKHLGIDWRRGERHFAARLLDYDLAANNGNWQWCASTGCDAQPWFRIFNPVTQSRRFDPRGTHIRRWVPELTRVPDALVHAPWEMPAAEQARAGCVVGRDYPAPIVGHEAARARALARYGAIRGG